MRIFFVYSLLKVYGHYDLSVLSVLSVMSFQKKVWIGGGWVGGVSSIHLFWIFGILLTLQSPYKVNNTISRRIKLVHVEMFQHIADIIL